MCAARLIFFQKLRAELSMSDPHPGPFRAMLFASARAIDKGNFSMAAAHRFGF